MSPDDFKKIISKAIGEEVAAFEFYNGVSEKTKDKSLKDLFKELAAEEGKHKRTLEGFLSMPPEKFHFAPSKDYKVADAVPTPALTPELKPIEGLLIAIRKELEAMQMYTQLAGTSADEAQKKIFLELASMERQHKARLEDIYTNMAFPEVW